MSVFSAIKRLFVRKKVEAPLQPILLMSAIDPNAVSVIDDLIETRRKRREAQTGESAQTTGD